MCYNLHTITYIQFLLPQIKISQKRNKPLYSNLRELRNQEDIVYYILSRYATARQHFHSQSLPNK